MILLLNLFSFVNRYKVISVLPKSEGDLQLLEDFESKGYIRYWNEPSVLNRQTSFQIPPSEYELIFSILAEQDLNPTILINDVQE